MTERRDVLHNIPKVPECFEYEAGWRDIPGDWVEVPGWDTVWLRNDVDPDYEDFFGVFATSVEPYPKGRYTLRDLVMKEMITSYQSYSTENADWPLGNLLARAWNSRAEVYQGRLVLPCPECHVGTVHTRLAEAEVHVDSGIRWTGVPCSSCKKSFTLSSAPVLEDPQGPSGTDMTPVW